MELDTLITYILLFLFFVLPSILKRKGKPKKAKAPKKKRKPSIFNKLGDVIQNFVQELEKQAQEAKKEQAKKEGSVWDQLDDRDAPFETREDVILEEDDQEGVAEYLAADPTPRHYDPEHPFVAPSKAPVSRAEKFSGKTPPPVPEESRPLETPGIRASIPTHALQQAVVWSEILGKPVALRKE